MTVHACDEENAWVLVKLRDGQFVKLGLNLVIIVPITADVQPTKAQRKAFCAERRLMLARLQE